MGVLKAAKRLRDECEATAFPRIPYVYNPLAYAWEGHASYCRTYGDAPGKRRVVLVGMNPGPHGMAQTGVPFGDVGWVRDWMGITGAHTQPARAHPKRPVQGFACTRREPSGSRLYAWASERYGSASAFFSEFFIVNYCPLLFFDEAGKNLTPPQLRGRIGPEVEEACDAHLAAVLRALAPAFTIGVGGYAEERARRVVEREGISTRVGSVLHPSPASPAANRGWARQAEAQLSAIGILPTALSP